MTPRGVSSARRLADEISGGGAVVRGPLQGYYHETYVVPLPGGMTVVKVREPRHAVLWFDRRCFRSELELLHALQGRITCVPDILFVEGVALQRFIEGRTVRPPVLGSRSVPEPVFDQIVHLFQEMAHISPDLLDVARRCRPEDHADDGDTDGFLECLITFAEEHVYAGNEPWFGRLFDALGLGYESFTHLRKHVSGLRPRPFHLLHGDLHRGNLIVDEADRLWTIDWELAMTGDPLYDLATHLYLMRYPADQERRMTREWRRAVERARPGSSLGWERDLPLVLDFKRAQSVFTDVIRVSLSLTGGPQVNWAALSRAARKLQRILAAAAVPLGLEILPSHAQIMAAPARWQRATALECA
jgi:hypothetical protein